MIFMNKNEEKKEETVNVEVTTPPVDNDELNKLKQNIIDLENKVKYSQAELINYRKRKDEETAGLLKYANKDLILELIPVADNFERAIKLDDNDLSDEVSQFLKGFKMIYTRLYGVLSNMEVKEIECEGKEFDPVYMQAVLTEHDETKPENVVLEVLQKGYMYKDKVIRPAMVKVNK